MPHMDDMRCKHCGALIALIPRASIVGRFSLRCPHCGVLLVIWPPERQALIVKVGDLQASQ
jgi:phage FluMu protein Com